MSRDSSEVEEGREVVRRTIVGGRPRAREKRRIRVPIGLEKVLCRAAGDPRFRAALLADRCGALDAAGYELLASERAVLDSVPPSVLGELISRIDVRRHGRGRFMRGVLAATFAATTTVALQGCESTPAGITPDDLGFFPDAADVQQVTADVAVSDEVDPSRGISPDVPDVVFYVPDVNADEGLRPDVSFLVDVSARPDLLVAPDTLGDRGARPDVLVEPDVMADGGVRPDVVTVDVDEALPLGILPDGE